MPAKTTTTKKVAAPETLHGLPKAARDFVKVYEQWLNDTYEQEPSQVPDHRALKAALEGPGPKLRTVNESLMDAAYGVLDTWKDEKFATRGCEAIQELAAAVAESETEHRVVENLHYLLGEFVSDIEAMRCKAPMDIQQLGIPEEAEHWFGAFENCTSGLDDDKGTRVQWPNLGILANKAKAIVDAASPGIWDEKAKDWIRPSGTVKQGRRPMFRPFKTEDEWENLEEKIKSLDIVNQSQQQQIRDLNGELSKACVEKFKLQKTIQLLRGKMQANKAKPMKFGHVRVETRHFEFEGFGRSLKEAWTMVRKAWRTHKKEYSDNVPWMSMKEFKENATVQNEIPFPCGLRDGERIDDRVWIS